MGDVRFLTHALLRRAARARLDQLRRRPHDNDQGTTAEDVVDQQQGGSR